MLELFSTLVTRYAGWGSASIYQFHSWNIFHTCDKVDISKKCFNKLISWLMHFPHLWQGMHFLFFNHFPHLWQSSRFRKCFNELILVMKHFLHMQTFRQFYNSLKVYICNLQQLWLSSYQISAHIVKKHFTSSHWVCVCPSFCGWILVY